MISKPHPIQPLEVDEHNILRFKSNAIVQYLLDAGPFDMNHLAVCNFSIEDREQFAQLIGYSLSGFGELSYVRDEKYSTASLMAETGKSELEARNDHLREELDAIKDGLRAPIARLYAIHPDDLGRQTG